MKIVVFQPPYPIGGTVASAEVCLQWMRTALEELEPQDQDLVLLPEYATTPGLSVHEDVCDFAKCQGAEFTREIAAAAKRLGCLIVLPSVIQSGARWFNQTLAFDTTGEVIATYNKMHLTDVERDEVGLTPGSQLTVFEYGGVRMAFATCFDLYFPEHFEALATHGVDVVLCPSYQRSESADRICLIAQARALDSGTYLIRSSYSMGKADVGGHSLVASPTGERLADAGAESGVLRSEINPKKKFMKPASHGQKIVEHRHLIASHRRPKAYRPYTERMQGIVEHPFPWLCAHRGLSEACPENTLPAFAAAVASGAHEIEFDLWPSRDGVPVVCHDTSVDRTTDGSGVISELDWEQIRRLDAGVYVGKMWRGVHMPRLEEVLELIDGRSGLNIHIKDEGQGGHIIKRTCDLLTEYALTDIAYLSLGTEAALQIARDYAPNISRNCLVSQDCSPRSIAIARQYDCQRIQLGRQVTKEDIQQAHEAGLVCNLFWSDDPEDALNYIRNGIDVILTNCVQTLGAAGLPTLSLMPR